MCGWNNKLLFILIGILTSPLFACGPHFPNSYLMSSDSLFTEMPGYSFPKEIERIPLNESPQLPAAHGVQTEAVDLGELSEALAGAGIDADRIKAVLADYGAIRKNLDRNMSFSTDQIPEEVPLEFSLYLEGAVYYKSDRHAEAISTWLKIIDLPPSQRQYRSTWAAYMLGRCAHLYRPHIAAMCYQRVRRMAEKGFKDTLGLAAASYGQEAAVYLRQRKYDKAIDFYLLQKQTGDRSAVPSLLLVCREIFEESDRIVLDTLVKHPNAIRVLMAYAVSRCSGYQSDHPQQILIDAIERVGLGTVEDAEQIALIAYEAGHFEETQCWRGLADMDSIVSRRIRAKMLLRAGDIEAAAADLIFVARHTESSGALIRYSGYNPYDSTYKVNSELGSLYVSQKMYTEAIDVLMWGGNWIDAAYIAERVLAVDELQHYIDTNWPASMLEPNTNKNDYASDIPKTLTLRYLLARRLSRSGEFESARPYYPEEILEYFDRLRVAMKKANDDTLSQTERADAFWTAAWLMRHKGMEMIGFELDPDWTIYRGNFDPRGRLEIRKALAEENTINVPDLDELERADQEVAIPDKRFHYRYFASELAWEAAALMENGDIELARRLCLAGSWTKSRDPKHADVFYKSLVLRCGTTALGKEADRIRWFPKIPDTLEAGEPFVLQQKPEEASE